MSEAVFQKVYSSLCQMSQPWSRITISLAITQIPHGYLLPPLTAPTTWGCMLPHSHRAASTRASASAEICSALGPPAQSYCFSCFPVYGLVWYPQPELMDHSWYQRAQGEFSRNRCEGVVWCERCRMPTEGMDFGWPLVATGDSGAVKQVGSG